MCALPKYHQFLHYDAIYRGVYIVHMATILLLSGVGVVNVVVVDCKWLVDQTELDDKEVCYGFTLIIAR